MKIVKPLDKIPTTGYRVFLAGSIEMGAAENWQDKLTELLSDADGYILNPRRDDWDSSWEQAIGNAQFYNQVQWELKAMEMVVEVVKNHQIKGKDLEAVQTLFNSSEADMGQDK